MSFDQFLVDRMREALQSRNGVAEKKMFGGYCWMLDGNLLCGVERGRFMFQVGRDLEVEALTLPGARSMDITGSGRPMTGFVWVNSEDAIRIGLKNWIEFAIRYVGSLAVRQLSR